MHDCLAVIKSLILILTELLMHCFCQYLLHRQWCQVIIEEIVERFFWELSVEAQRKFSLDL